MIKASLRVLSGIKIDLVFFVYPLATSRRTQLSLTAPAVLWSCKYSSSVVVVGLAFNPAGGKDRPSIRRQLIDKFPFFFPKKIRRLRFN